MTMKGPLHQDLDQGDRPEGDEAVGGKKLAETEKENSSIDDSSDQRRPSFPSMIASHEQSSSTSLTRYSAINESLIQDPQKGPISYRRASAEIEIQRINDQLAASHLKFHKLGLYGRDQELEFLNERCLQGNCKKKQLIMIDGVSGTGKTSLAFSMKRPIQSQGGIFSSGKFDLELRELPYSGIIEVCNDICTQIIHLSADLEEQEISTGAEDRALPLLARVREALLSDLGEKQVELLVQLIPMLAEILNNWNDQAEEDGLQCKKRDNSSGEPSQQRTNTRDVDPDALYGSDQSKSKIHFAFQSFFRTLSRRFDPFLILLDDLQWADTASLAVIESLLVDRDKSNLIIVGAYRSDEVSSTHPVSLFIKDMEECKGKFDFFIFSLSIGNLKLEHIQRILQDLLSVDDNETTMELSQLCHRRTEGNVFFLLSFIRLMKAEGILHFNAATFKWVWKIEDAEKMWATENLVDLLKRKMTKYTDDVAEFLLVSACLGSSFDASLLELVWQKFSCKDNVTHQKPCSFYLELCIGDGILDMRRSSSTVQWVHDQVQEAALTLAIDQHPLKKTKALIGNILKDAFRDDVSSKIFLIVNLLSDIDNEENSIELARLNLQASQKASSLSAFASAALYSTTGINYLPHDRWSSYPELTLNLYSIAAESTSYNAQMDLMQHYVDEIIERDDVLLLDKVRAYEVMVRQWNVSGNLQKAHDLLLDLLENFGLKFPRRKIPKLSSTAFGLFRMKRDLGQISPNTILKMPKLTDPQQLAILNLAGRVIATGYLLKSDYLPIMISLSCHITVKHGICKNSFAALLFGAMILIAVFDDFKGATRIGDSIMKLLEDPYFRDRTSHVYMAVYTVLYPWTKQIQSMAKPLLKGYQGGLEIGDVEAALWVRRSLASVFEQAPRPCHICSYISPC